MSFSSFRGTGVVWNILVIVSGAVSAWQFSREDPSQTFNYLTTADWGDDSAGQHACAAGMGAVAAEIDAKHVFMLGDNFYPSGIHARDGKDGEDRIKKTFENVYTAESLQNLTF